MLQNDKHLNDLMQLLLQDFHFLLQIHTVFVLKLLMLDSLKLPVLIFNKRLFNFYEQRPCRNHLSL